MLQEVKVLLVTVSPLETSATYSFLRPLDDHDYVFTFYQAGQQTKVIYYIGKYGICPAAIRGNIDDENTGTVLEMADKCFPNLGAVISVGMACGIRGKIKLCDVLVSERIVNYMQDKNEHKYSPRGEPIIVLPELLKLFTDGKSVEWPDDVNREYLKYLNKGLPTVKSGVILSGPYSIDDSAMKNTLTADFAYAAKGVEMGGAHLVAENQEVMISTIIVKAVCDYGDGRNNKIYQPIAALLAADLVHKCLDSDQALQIFKGLPHSYLNNVSMCFLVSL